MDNIIDENSVKLELKGVESIFVKNGIEIDFKRLYCNYFGKVPSIIFVSKLNYSKCLNYIEENYSVQILDRHSFQRLNLKSGKYLDKYMFLILRDNIIIYFIEYHITITELNILFQEKNSGFVKSMMKELIRFKLKISTKNKIYLITNNFSTLEKIPIKIKKPKIKIETHYNNNLGSIHLNILKQFNAKNESGLFLFHGDPGTGKSTYIRYLIHHINKVVIFISPSSASNLESPSFTSFLIKNPNSIFIVEDVENLISSRDSENNSAISMILNLTDGLLGDGLGIQFICTFNTHISRIDKALLRKGRLKAQYEFNALSVEKSNSLLKSLSLNHVTNKPMTLAEIYNLKEKGFEFEQNKQKIGFAA